MKIRSSFPLLAAALASCAALGGGRPLSRGPELPAAAGRVSFTRMGSDATAVEVRVRNLPEPEELRPPGYAYVAWVQASREQPPLNLGLLDMSDDFSGELRALTKVECSELFITAEATGDAERPTGRRLMWASCD